MSEGERADAIAKVGDELGTNCTEEVDATSDW